MPAHPILDDLAALLDPGQVLAGDAALDFDRDLSDGTGHGVPLVPRGARTGLATRR